jgi:hypothetical protein
MDTLHLQNRLAETIAWCSLQNLVSDPPETDEFRHRQQLERQGRALYRRAELLEKRNSLQSWLLDHFHLGPRENAEELRHQGLELMRAGDVTPILPLNHQLRTLELRPRPFAWPQTDRMGIVEELAEKRARFLRQRDTYPRTISTDLAGGRLLAYEPDENVADGASQHQTKGYFDGDDAPPWDTWVCYVDRSLISWVPPMFRGLVQEGVSVNCVDCIHWTDEYLFNKEQAAPSRAGM